MPDQQSLFTYTFTDNNASRTLLLLHGTGGTENDFLFLDEPLRHSYNLLGIRGNVDEGGMSRYFKRLSPGVFDQKSIQTESEKLSIFIRDFKLDHPREAAVFAALGYSNGANMLLATLFSYPAICERLALLHPMMPVEVAPDPTLLSNFPVLVTRGLSDTMVTREENIQVCAALTECGATVTVHEYRSGHEVNSAELRDVVDFLLY